MKRTKLSDRLLPDYTRGEEIMNMVTHIVGGGLGVLALILCVVRAAMRGNLYGVVSGAIYGTSMIFLYTVSSVYHGLRPSTAKKVMQVLDHCVIYILIAGTYTPILFSALRPAAPGWAWTLFGAVWGMAAVAITFTAIDLKKYAVFSMICYIGMGWCVVAAWKTVVSVLHPAGLQLLLWGGIAYTVGAVLYGLGSRRRYMHGAFHVFVVLGSVLQFLCVFLYVI